MTSARISPAIPAAISGFFRYALLGTACAYLLVWIWLASRRIPYPYELEWMEGAVVDHVRRILAGEPVYVEPSVAFTSLIYPPLYYYGSALLSQLTGVGFFPLRLLSAGASAGCLAILFAWSRRETGSPLYGIVSASLFAATFELGGAWLDVARVDCLFLLWVLVAAYLLRFKKSPLAAGLAGAALALAALTKQPALVVALVFAVYCLAARGLRAGTAFCGSFALIFGVPTLVLHRLTDGWYGYYLFDLPSQHPFFPVMLTGFWNWDLLRPLPITCLLLAIYLGSRFLARKKMDPEQRHNAVFYGAFVSAMLAAAWLSRLHYGGASNVLLPAHAALALLWGMAVHSPLWRAGERPKDAWAPSAVHALALMQFGWLFYNPLDYLPTRADTAAGDRFVQTIASLPGEVYLPEHGYLASLGGKTSYPHIAMYWDVLRGDDNPTRRKLERELASAFRNHRFSAVIIHAPRLTFPFIMNEVNRYYENKRAVFKGDMVFGQINFSTLNKKMNPRLYLPKSRARAGN